MRLFTRAGYRPKRIETKKTKRWPSSPPGPFRCGTLRLSHLSVRRKLGLVYRDYLHRNGGDSGCHLYGRCIC